MNTNGDSSNKNQHNILTSNKLWFAVYFFSIINHFRYERITNRIKSVHRINEAIIEAMSSFHSPKEFWQNGLRGTLHRLAVLSEEALSHPGEGHEGNPLSNSVERVHRRHI